MAEVTRQERAAGATETKLTDVKGKIVEFLWYLKKKGLSEVTIKNYGYKLNKLVEAEVDLRDPENVKEYLARRGDWSERTKLLTVMVYDGLARW